MKINLDPKKGAEKLSLAVQKSSDVSKTVGQKAISTVQQGAKVLADKTKDEAYLRRLKKYNPLFPEVYLSLDFNLPNVIIVVDDADRKGIDVCEGAIGWLSKDSGIEVMYLYDEAVPMSGLTFIPTAECNKAYHVDSFDRSRFIQVDNLFKKVQEDKLAELEQVAYSLGAKRCTIEIVESTEEKQQAKKKFSLKESVKFGSVSASNSESTEQEMRQATKKEGKNYSESIFRGSDNPKRPELKWFAHDENIKGLIEMRCNDINSIQTKTLKLMGSSSATMSQKTACAIDSAVGKLGGKASVKGEGSMEAQASSESKSTLIFTVEF